MKNNLLLISVALFAHISGFAEVLQFKCATTPCPNTPNGDSPEQSIIKKGAEFTAELRNAADDKLRWSAVALYSDSKHPERLKMKVIKNFQTEMGLSPQDGLITFSGPQFKQSFKIAPPATMGNSPCQKYNIRIIEAGSGYALIKKICPLHEYLPGRHLMSADYYLFDQQTSTMRSIWSAAVTDKDLEFPDAVPELSVKKLSDGYRFDWTGVFPSDGKPTKQIIRNIYTRRTNAKPGAGLLCKDSKLPVSQGIESDMCEGPMLDLVPNSR